MIKNFFHSFLLRRHFWRHATFSEIAELYTSRMLRMAAMHMAGAFMSIYLYQIGYSVAHIALFWAAIYLFKLVVSIPNAALAARIGPKHSILISNLLYIPAMVGFALLPIAGPMLLIPILIFEGISSSLYSIAYSINFSKVKSVEHAGKEIAYMNIIEKVTTGLSPLIGGALAFLFGPQLVIIIAAVLFALAALPLMLSGEQIETGKKLQFKGFPWRLLTKHWMATLAYGFDVFSSGTVWTLYTAVLVIGITSSNDIYLATGILSSVILLAALVASYVYGKLIDKKHGKELMQLSVVVNSVVHLVRPFINTPVAVAGLNATNEVATTGYTMPYTRAVFDNADLSGHRITYIGIVDLLANFGAACAALALALFAFALGSTEALTNFFFIASGVVLLVLTGRFSLYKK